MCVFVCVCVCGSSTTPCSVALYIILRLECINYYYIILCVYVYTHLITCLGINEIYVYRSARRHYDTAEAMEKTMTTYCRRQIRDRRKAHRFAGSNNNDSNDDDNNNNNRNL